MTNARRRVFRAAALPLCLATTLAGCATNPVTGRRELALVSEKQELAMGLQAYQEVNSTMGVYPDEKLNAYVQELGMNMASKSERPNLPWKFQVLDDASVNAFALPGGYIYVTRGMMTHLNSEAELAAVLGHEIAHVTARHSVSQMSNAQLAQIGLLAGMILKPELQRYGNLAQMGMGLLSLQNSRSHERQADALGLRYMTGSEYRSTAMLEVFELLRDVSRQDTHGRLPSWLATHPDPENRLKLTSEAIQKLGPQSATARLERDAYLQHIDGMVFGDNPREGYFEGNVFYHPDMAFTVTFPQGWEYVNQKQGVVAASPQKDAMVQISLSSKKTPQDAALEFLQQPGIRTEQPGSFDIHGLPAVASRFVTQTQQGQTISGIAAFVAHEGKIFQILGYGAAGGYSSGGGYGSGGATGAEALFSRTIDSFQRLTDQKALSVQPRRLEVVRVENQLTLDQFAKRYPSDVPLDSLALINQTARDGSIEAGSLAKRVISSAPVAPGQHEWNAPSDARAAGRPEDAREAFY